MHDDWFDTTTQRRIKMQENSIPDNKRPHRNVFNPTSTYMCTGPYSSELVSLHTKPETELKMCNWILPQHYCYGRILRRSRSLIHDDTRVPWHPERTFFHLVHKHRHWKSHTRNFKQSSPLNIKRGKSNIQYRGISPLLSLPPQPFFWASTLPAGKYAISRRILQSHGTTDASFHIHERFFHALSLRESDVISSKWSMIRDAISDPLFRDMQQMILFCFSIQPLNIFY